MIDIDHEMCIRDRRYPESSYLPLLASEIARMDARQNLMSNIAETNFPDVELPDMFGRKGIKTRESGFEIKMLPTWRPDKAMAKFLDRLNSEGKLTKTILYNLCLLYTSRCV